MEKFSVIILLICTVTAITALYDNQEFKRNAGNQKYPVISCLDILRKRKNIPPNGVYWIRLRQRQAFPVYCDMNAGGWTMIFKGVAGAAGAMSTYWKSPYTMYEFSIHALNERNSLKRIYKNRIVQNWKDFKPNQARVVLYKATKEEVVLRFNASNTDNMNWFTLKNLQEAPWTDIASATKNYFTISGPTHGNGGLRDFFINHSYGGCPNDAGWITATDEKACAWEKRTPKLAFFYSKKDTFVNWNKYNDTGLADVLAVYVR